MNTARPPLKIGAAGLGRAFTLMLPTFSADQRVEALAAFETRPGSALTHQHFGPLIVSCERGDVRPLPDAVWVVADPVRTRHALVPPP